MVSKDKDTWSLKVTAPEGYKVRIYGGAGQNVGEADQEAVLLDKAEYFVNVDGLGTFFLTNHGNERPIKQSEPNRFPSCFTNCPTDPETKPEYDDYIEVNGSGRFIGYMRNRGQIEVVFYRKGEFVVQNTDATEVIRDVCYDSAQHLGLLEQRMLLMVSGSKTLHNEWNENPMKLLQKMGFPMQSVGGFAMPYQINEFSGFFKSLKFEDNHEPLPADAAHHYRRTGNFAADAQLFGHIKCKLCKVGFAAAAAALLVAVAAAVGVTGGAIVGAVGQIAAFASSVGLSVAVVTPIVEKAAKNLKSFVGEVLEAVCHALGTC